MLEELLKNMKECVEIERKPAPRDKTEMFQPIQDLQVGEKVRIRIPAYYKIKATDVLIVYRIFTPSFDEKIRRSIITMEDFSTILEDEDGTLFEISFDSRYFERVKE